MAKLSKGNRDTLEILKGKIPEALIADLEKAILDAKEKAGSRERKPREVSFEFTARDAQIFRMRVLEGTPQPEIEKNLGVEPSVVNAAIRSVSYKILNILTSPTTDENGEVVAEPELPRNVVEEVLLNHATQAERKAKADKTVAEVTPATNAPATSATSPDDVAAALSTD